MKHTFAKKALLLGTISIFFSIAPIRAMDPAAGAPMDPALQREVQTQAGTFSKWSREALRKKLDDSMKFLDREWNKFIKCLKGEGCTKAQIAVITSTLATILAIITVLTGAALYRFGPESLRTWVRGKGEALGEFGATPRPWFTGRVAPALQRIGTPAAGMVRQAGEVTETYVTEPIGRRVITPAAEKLRAAREWARQRAAGLPGRAGQYFQTPAETEE